MPEAGVLTVTEQHVMLGILRLQPNAYGVSIRDEIRKRTGRDYSFGSVYAVLERLEDRGLIASHEGEVTASRGGRKKQYFTVKGAGKVALQASLQATDAMRKGIELGEALA